MKHVFDRTIAYSPRTASRAFDPPASTEAIRRAVQFGLLKTIAVGKRRYILRDELIRAAEAGVLK